jgi:hypothetical protein
VKLHRACDQCQRCERHCFRDPGCRLALHREVCLTCSNAVSFIQGIDYSRVRTGEETVTNSRVSKTPNRWNEGFYKSDAPGGSSGASGGQPS